MIERRASNQNKPDKVPAWMVTFADLMALMMTFFVLLYSFSKVDENKYKTIVNSMTIGFDGSQWIKRKMGSDNPTGPEPGVFQPPQVKYEIAPANNGNSKTDSLYDTINEQLQEEITQNKLSIIQQANSILIRFPDKISFESGSDVLLQSFAPVIRQIANILKNTNGHITISGHTDDLPIRTDRFRSNWDLSAARAVSVAHLLIQSGEVDKQRITIEGHADSQPLKPNNTQRNRAANRRVEISIHAGTSAETTNE